MKELSYGDTIAESDLINITPIPTEKIVTTESEMPDPVEMFRKTTLRVREIVASVEQSQAQYPTPCSEWDVRGILNHLIGGLEFTAGCIAGNPPDIRVAEADSSYIDEPDIAMLIEAYHTLLDRVLQSGSEPGALDGIVSTPYFGEMPVSQIFIGTTMDQLIHGWDLAKATGQDTTLDAGLVEFAYGMLSSGFAEMGRQAGFIGPEVAIPEDGSPQDKLIAYMGRQP